MKKHLLIFAGCLLLATVAHSQTKASDVFDLIEKLPDQFDKQLDTDDLDDTVIMIYIPGSNNPFQKIYTKRKAARLKKNAVLVGGFKEMMGGMSLSSKKSHLQEALAIRYKEGSQILIDLNSEVAAELTINGYAIVTLSKKRNKVLKIEDFGFDRIKFFEALDKYELPAEEGSND